MSQGDIGLSVHEVMHQKSKMLACAATARLLCTALPGTMIQNTLANHGCSVLYRYTVSLV
jgi:hypothetical protein